MFPYYNVNMNSITRSDPRFAPSQWETSLQSNAVSHWLGANLESDLITHSLASRVYSSSTGPKSPFLDNIHPRQVKWYIYILKRGPGRRAWQRSELKKTFTLLHELGHMVCCYAIPILEHINEISTIKYWWHRVGNVKNNACMFLVTGWFSFTLVVAP